MKKGIIAQMSAIVEKDMTSYKSDFYEYDIKALENYDGAFIWQVASSHTHLTKCDVESIAEEMRNNEAFRYDYARHQTWGEAVISYQYYGEKIFYYGGDDDNKGLVEVPRFFAVDAYIAALDKASDIAEEAGVTFPTDFKVHVHFGDVATQREFIKCVRYAREHGDDSLLGCAKMFHNWRKVAHNHTVTIYKDAYNDKCFSFCEKRGDKYGIVGGLIFHGYDEYTTNGSVQLTPTKGWAMHT